MTDTHRDDTLTERSLPPQTTVVLVADLDGTLCRTDTLHEALLGLLSRRPGMIFTLLGWVMQGKAAFKDQVANAHVIAGTGLPLNAEVIETLRAARAAGQRTALVTASDQRQADAVADSTNLFDEVHGSNGTQNLKGANKAAFLTERFGAGGFDYMGDAMVDVPVWKQARKAVTVGASPAVRRAAEGAAREVEHLSPPPNMARAMFRAMRPHQWSKNLLLFLPMLAAHDLSRVGAVFLGFIVFCFTASAVYIINDLLDLADDRTHPRKSKRPFAAGDLTAGTGLAAAGVLLLVALCLTLLSGELAFLGILTIYLLTTFLYSLWLKRKLLVDVLTLAGLYTIRIIAGGAVVGLYLSPWLLGFSMFLFLALAAVKRQAELTDQIATGRESAGRAYLVDDLPLLMAMALSSSMAAVLVFALYISSDAVQLLYDMPAALWLLCPIILYWQLRMVTMAHRGYMTDDPIVFAARDRTSQITIATAIAIATIATFI
jgi:4-hydroxybenzoate polyprenyltransferase/phosphoserine phosphatase